MKKLYQDNLLRLVQSANDSERYGILSSVSELKISNIDSILDNENDSSFSARIFRKHHQAIQKLWPAESLIEDVDAIEAMIDAGYFDRLRKESSDKIESFRFGAEVQSGGVTIDSGTRRPKWQQWIIGKIRQRFALPLSFDDIYYKWEFYANFSVKNGLVSREENLKMMEQAMSEIPESSSSEILTQVLSRGNAKKSSTRRKTDK